MFLSSLAYLTYKDWGIVPKVLPEGCIRNYTLLLGLSGGFGLDHLATLPQGDALGGQFASEERSKRQQHN